jgi:hypothetical protein
MNKNQKTKRSNPPSSVGPRARHMSKAPLKSHKTLPSDEVIARLIAAIFVDLAKKHVLSIKDGTELFGDLVNECQGLSKKSIDLINRVQRYLFVLLVGEFPWE